MTITMSDLRLSAQRALLGAVCRGVRLVRITAKGDDVAFSALLANDHDPVAQEELSCAFTEILADFPESRGSESFSVTDEPLPRENLFDAGWVFARHEPDTTMVQ